VYVINCLDRRRIDENSEELQELLQEERLAGVPLLVFANKQDLLNAMKEDEVRRCTGGACVANRLARPCMRAQPSSPILLPCHALLAPPYLQWSRSVCLPACCTLACCSRVLAHDALAWFPCTLSPLLRACPVPLCPPRRRARSPSTRDET